MRKHFICVLVCTLAVHLTGFAQYKQIQKTITVTDQKVSVALTNLKPSDCITGPGAITITPSGGSGNYTFLWSGPGAFSSTNKDLTGLAPGTYSLTISDGPECTQTFQWTVPSTCASSCTFLVTKSITNASSCSIPNGSINISISGGSNSFLYEWYLNGIMLSTTEDISGLAPGYYELRYRDANNASCGTRFEAFTITSPFVVNTTVTQNTSCQPPYTGAITPVVAGGSGNYAYLWTLPSGGVSTLPTLTGVPSGNYTLAVTDLLLGCTQTKYVSVNTTSSLTITTNTVKNNSRCSPSDGGVDITVSGGTGNYTFSWYNQTTFTFAGAAEDLVNVRAGLYSVYVTDNVSKCSAYQSFTITESLTAPSYTILGSTANSNCLPPYNGSISLQPIGTGPFSVQWIKGQLVVSTEEDPTNLGPGNYGFVLTDLSLGCSVTVSENSANAIIIPDESLPSVSVNTLLATSNTGCATPNGAIQLDITSTTTYYNLQWNGPNNFSSTNEDLTNLAPGDYQLTINVACNLPPVITPPQLPLQKKSVTINLLDYVSDPDNNLDPSKLRIVDQPISGGQAFINKEMLTIEYDGVVFTGEDQLKIEACDLLNACTENMILIPIELRGELIVHNAVAPNSTGDNKFMRVFNLPDEVTNRVNIYNRWGDRVFHVEGYNNEVPGKRFEGFSMEGKELPTGTYFYKIEFSDGAETITGYLSLKW